MTSTATASTSLLALATEVGKAMKVIMSLGLAARFGRHMNACRMNGDSVRTSILRRVPVATTFGYAQQAGLLAPNQLPASQTLAERTGSATIGLAADWLVYAVEVDR